MKINFNGIELDVPKEVLDKETYEIKKDDVVIFNKPDFDIRLKNESDSAYIRGKIAGEEMNTKQLRDKFGIEIDGKDLDKISDAIKTKILKDANIEPDKALKERDSIIEQLRANMAKIEAEKTAITNQFTEKEKKMRLDSLLFSAIPDKAVSDSLSKNDIGALFRSNGFDITEQDGKVVALKNGEVVKNATTLEPLAFNEVVTKFVTDKKLIVIDGRGAGDGTTKDTPGSIEAFEKEMEAKGLKYGTPEYYSEMNERIKNKTLKL